MWFLGSNLAAYGIKNGCKITIFDNLSRVGSKFYLWRYTRKTSIQKVIQNEKFDTIFHLAGQVAMTSSIENPYKDFEINALGTISVLEAVRKFSPKTAVFFLAQIKSMVI